MNGFTILNVPSTPVKKTTALSEWLGWCGILLWMYMMINDYHGYSAYGADDIFRSVFAFELLFSLTILIVGLCFGRDPNGLGRLAFLSTPVAIALTAGFSFLPAPFHSVAYALAPVFIAPALVRVVHGVVQTARPGYTIMTYMSGIATAYALVYVVFRYEDYCLDVLLTSPPSKTLFALYSLLLVPAWFSTRRDVTVDDEASDEETQAQSMVFTGLTREEMAIAMLLIDGETRRDILRKLRLTAADYSRHEQAIREKIAPDAAPDPRISAVVETYRLTKRETEMLLYLRDNVSTEQIAAELFIYEDTVRSHVRNLLLKVGFEKRQDVAAWLESRE